MDYLKCAIEAKLNLIPSTILVAIGMVAILENNIEFYFFSLLKSKEVFKVLNLLFVYDILL